MCMTRRRRTVSLPQDVEAVLEKLPERAVSSYIAEAVRARAGSDQLRDLMRRVGHTNIPAYDPEGAR